MASFFISGTSTVAQTLAALENGFIASGATLYTETATAVTITGSCNLTVMGAVATSTGVAAVRTSLVADFLNIVVGSQGAISSASTDGIRVAIGTLLDLRNDGLITGEDAVFVQGTDSDSLSIVNSGRILARNQALEFTSAITDMRINNSGTIAGGQSASGAAILSTSVLGLMDISNSGVIESTETAIQSSGGVGIDNLGRISGTVIASSLGLTNSGEVVGDMLADQFLQVENSGTILGKLSITGTGSTSVTNSGLISGSILAGLEIQMVNTGTIEGGIAVDFGSLGFSSILNRGQILSSVSLGDGSDIFQNLGGTVSSTIKMEGGADLCIIDSAALVVDGGAGNDTLESSVSCRIGVNFETLELTGDLGLQGMGRTTNDRILGGEGNDTLLGRGGNDTLTGGEGDDLLQGGTQGDTLILSAGTDTLVGGQGRDLVVLQFQGSGVVANLALGLAQVTDPDGEIIQTASLSGIEDAFGSTSGDLITGSAGANALRGDFGADTLNGGNGNDSLFGGSGNDLLTGGGGNDFLTGGSFGDTLSGGGLADVFIFEAIADSAVGQADRITDFDAAAERIDLAVIDADTVAAGDQVFVFVGSLAFAGAGAQVRAEQDAGANTTTVQVRLAGSAQVDMEITLTGLINLTGANFDL